LLIYYFDPESGEAIRYRWSNELPKEYNGSRELGKYASWKIDGSWFVFDEAGVLMINNWCYSDWSETLKEKVK